MVRYKEEDRIREQKAKEQEAKRLQTMKVPDSVKAILYRCWRDPFHPPLPPVKANNSVPMLALFDGTSALLFC